MPEVFLDGELRLAVVGAGYFGTNHCRKLASLPGVKLAAVVDVDQDRAREAAARFGAEALCSHRDLAGRVQAAIVAVPTSIHHRVASELLDAGLNLLVEKPLASTSVQARELCRLSAGRGVILQVGHLERFNPAFIEASRRVCGLRYVRMERCGPFPGRGADVDVVLEVMAHDLDLLLQLNRCAVESVAAAGWPVVTSGPDVATARIVFSDGMVAELLASRVSHQRIRAFSVLDREGTLEVDLAGGRLRQTRCGTGGECTEEQQLPAGDPLLEQDRSFVEAVRGGTEPRVGGEAGVAVVALAERILGSIAGKSL